MNDLKLALCPMPIPGSFENPKCRFDCEEGSCALDIGRLATDLTDVDLEPVPAPGPIKIELAPLVANREPISLDMGPITLVQGI